MDIKITPTLLKGSVTIPPSKSAAHRAIICAGLTDGVSIIKNVAFSQDVLATLGAINAIGGECEYSQENSTVRIMGVGSNPHKSATINCKESGSVLRFFVPIASALGMNTLFLGEGKLPQRPIKPLSTQMLEHGVFFTKEDGMPFSTIGQLTSGRFELAGNISSQFITGLLFALPVLEGDSKIVLTTPLESVDYVNMTIDMMEKFGVKVHKIENGYLIEGNQTYKPCDVTIEADFSNGAFWLCAGALGSDIICKGLDLSSLQGDKAVVQVLREFGCSIKIDQDIKPGKLQLNSMQIDAMNIPDLVPILAVVAAVCEGQTVIYNAQRLRIKECDRLSAIRDCINRIGGEALEVEDQLIIQGKPSFYGGEVEGYNDHRIVMSMAIAATVAANPVIIRGAEAIHKSYPNFFEHYKALGGKIDVI